MSLFAGYRKQFELAARRHRLRRGWTGDHDIGAPGDHVGHGRRGAAILDLRDLSVGHELEQLHAKMRLCAQADRGIVELAGIGLGVSDQFTHVVCRHLGIGHQHEFGLGQHADRREIAKRIVRQITIECGIDHEIGVDRHEQRVAVGRRARDIAGGEPAVCSRPVLHDHGLFHLLGKPLGKRASDQVDRSAGGLRQNQPDRMGRIILRPRQVRWRGHPHER